MESSANTILDQQVGSTSIRRRKLQPWWMKAFSWVFMIFGAMIPVVFIMASMQMNSKIAIYGLETTNPISIVGVALTLIYILKGITAYGLWFEKDWAIKLGFVDVAVGFVACLCVMVVFPLLHMYGAEGMTFRVEILFLAFFLSGLWRIRKQWN